MKAAVLFELNKPLEIIDIELPALKRGQVLVQMAYSGVCKSQLMEASGKRGEDRYLPHLLGHEGSGVVVEVGDGVTKVKKNDTVILGWIKGKGIDASGAIYNYNGQNINSGGVTTFSEYTVASENRLTLLPKDIPMDVAILFGCAVPTGAGIPFKILKPAKGTTVAVFGLGGIGLSALMATLTFEDVTVVGVDVSEQKLEFAKLLGAHYTINAKSDNPVERLRDLSGGHGVDYCIEASGFVSTIEQAFESIKRKGGKCVFASHPAQGEKICIDPFELINGKSISGTWGGATDPDRDTEVFAKLFLEGRFPIDKMIQKTYSLNQINEALQDLEDQKVFRPVIEINSKLHGINQK